MLWLALRFASLPLEVFTRAARGSAPLAYAAADVIAGTGAARRIGVAPGMPVAAALALSATLTIVPRDAAAEEAALKRVAAWAIQFTPAVSIAAPCEVLLEIEGSLGVF